MTSERSFAINFVGIILDMVIMRRAIWYYFYNFFKNVKNTPRGVLLLAKFQAELWMFFTFFKLYERYQISRSIAYHLLMISNV